MNPGLMKSRCVVERQKTGRDASGQPVDEWEEVARFRARRMKAKGEARAPVKGDREREKLRGVFRRRARHAEVIEIGDRLREKADRGLRESLWDITAIEPVDSLYVDLLCEWLE